MSILCREFVRVSSNSTGVSDSTSKHLPRYLKDWYLQHIRSSLARRLAAIWKNLIENFFILKDMYLLTRIIIFAHWHHLMKQSVSS